MRPLLGDLLLVTFDEATTDFGQVIDRLNQRYGTTFDRFEHTDEHVARVFAAIDDKQRVVHGDARYREAVARPDASRAHARAAVGIQLPRHRPEAAELVAWPRRCTPSGGRPVSDRLSAWTRRRAQLLVVSAIVVVGCFLQAPGRLVRDTKLDLVIDPVGFLGRTLHLWDPSASFGQLQNQAVGYLFPIGPYFAIGHALGIPDGSSSERGSRHCSSSASGERCGCSRPWASGPPGPAAPGAAAYGLSPSILTLVGFQSGAELPHALLPWALLPW